MRLAGIVAALLVAVAPASAQVIDEMSTIGPFFGACIEKHIAPEGHRGPREATFRLSFRRDGTLFGEPTRTFSQPPATDPQQALFLQSLRKAMFACSPLPFSNALGGAMAGRPFPFRYILRASKDLRA
jgi:hypothetical protein